MKSTYPSLWRLLLALAVALALATPTQSQTPQEKPPTDTFAEKMSDLMPPEVGVFTLQSIELNDFIRMLRLFGINAESGHSLDNKHYIRFNKPDAVEQAQQLLKKLDIPFKNIALRISLVHAKDKGPTTKPVDDPIVADQLKQLFNFNSYNVLSTSYLVAKSGQKASMSLEGLPLIKDKVDLGTQRFEVETVPSFIDEGSGVVRLQNLEIDRIHPSNSTERTALLETTLNIKDTETVIVGGSMLEGETYIVIVTAEIIP